MAGRSWFKASAKDYIVYEDEFQISAEPFRSELP
jgi:hypothetical protein